MLVTFKSALASKAHLYARGVIQDTCTIEGELIATPKWVEYPAIAVKYGQGRYEYSIIAKDQIIEVIGEQIDLSQPAKPKFKVVEVQGSKGDMYTVTIGEKHSNCTCHAFQFRRSCKHIKQVLEAA